METLDSYLRMLGRLNDTWWRNAEPLEKRLKELEARYSSIGPVGTDTAKAATAQKVEQEIQDVVKRLNDVYYQWTMNLRLAPTPPPTGLPTDWTSKIPWPTFVSSSAKQFILNSIKQKGVAVSDRVTLKKGPGTVGVGLEIRW